MTDEADGTDVTDRGDGADSGDGANGGDGCGEVIGSMRVTMLANVAILAARANRTYTSTINDKTRAQRQ